MMVPETGTTFVPGTSRNWRLVSVDMQQQPCGNNTTGTLILVGQPAPMAVKITFVLLHNSVPGAMLCDTVASSPSIHSAFVPRSHTSEVASGMSAQPLV